MKAHCLMHVPFEGPGAVAEWFGSRGVELQYWKLYEKADLPRPGDIEFLLVMGGPMNIYDYGKCPWLKEEKSLIGQCIRENRKVLGICLGAQLIADVLGERIFPNEEKEIGWFPVRGGGLLPETFVPFHWHEDTFNLPSGAVHLASSESCRNQAFSMGTNVLAFQFHMEITPVLLEGMLKNVPGDPGTGSHVQSREEIMEGLAHTKANLRILNGVLESFTGKLIHG